ncbi:MAG TPA: 6-carboxytetrahydropterin synthase [Phycisphaerae bacterium]|nr:6-carboxytetrahydropterin synthase [Phycisphaerales bacterium]HRX83670.1 6-carboxytetrahydropterin synthase [Phycisphaerae bacterium]
MYEVSVEAQFSAAHRLRLADGTLEPPHGHDWHVTVVFAGAQLDPIGVLVDFIAAEARLRSVVGELHHTDLNACPAMRGLNPSAEHVARVIYEQMAADPQLAEALQRVRVSEAPGCAATYIGGERG